MNRKMTKTLLAAAMLAAPLPAMAANLAVTDAWARATMPGQRVSGAYLKITADENARLIGASSPKFPRVELHEMHMDGNVMRMREVKALELPKGKSVVLKPGGHHIMLMNLPGPIVAGERIPLVLTIEAGGKLQQVHVEAEARAPGTMPMPPGHSH